MVEDCVLKDLDEMIDKMNEALSIYRCNLKLAKDLNIDLPLEFKNKMAGLAAMVNICDKVHYYKSNKGDILFGDWVKLCGKPSIEETMIVVILLNEYRELKNEIGDVEYFIPDELCRK